MSPNSHENGRPDSGNVYMAAPAEAPSQETLDAGAPAFRSTDSQRLNKKALWFLAGIALLVAMGVFLLLRGSKSRADDVAPTPQQERVEVPQGPVAPPLPPDTPPQQTDAEPIALAGSDTALPPMPEPPPVQNDDYPVARVPSLVERRTMADMQASPPSLLELDAMRAQQQQTPQLASTKATSAVFLRDPNTLLLRGTYVRCALETRIITDVDGFTSCVVTEPVYSVNGRRLLLPKGSKVLGQYGSGAIRGERVAVVWDRLVTPTGIDVTMASPGVDNLGSSGHPGDRDEHWGSRIASALFISLLSDAFKYYGEKEGPSTVTAYPGAGAVVQQPFESNTARTIERLANQAAEAGGQRPPTVTINQGTIVNIYVSQDVDFGGVLRN